MIYMNTRKRSVSLITLFLFPFTIASSIDNCSTSKCRVTSPFRTPDQPATCGLPGFDLSCDFPYDTPILSFPSPGHNFSVDSINYYSKVITVSDPEGCLQKKLLGFDPSGTPFGFRYQAAYYFPIYNCSRSINLPNYYQDLEIGCLSGSNYSVFWDKYYLASSNYYSRCDFVGEALGPGDWAVYTSVFSSAVSVDLSWKLPAGCQRCVYGGCQRHPNYATGVTCSASPPAPPSKDITKIVLPIIATPVLVLLALVCVCISCKARSSTPHATLRDTFPSNNINITSQTTSHLNPNSQSSVLPIGLEQHTLDAYPIMMVGGSGRILLNMEDKTCPICLSDYEPRDTLKTLPECLHRFHAECIDEWLRAKALCPVCRTPPPRPRPSS